MLKGNFDYVSPFMKMEIKSIDKDCIVPIKPKEPKFTNPLFGPRNNFRYYYGETNDDDLCQRIIMNVIYKSILRIKHLYSGYSFPSFINVDPIVVPSNIVEQQRFIDEIESMQDMVERNQVPMNGRLLHVYIDILDAKDRAKKYLIDREGMI